MADVQINMAGAYNAFRQCADTDEHLPRNRNAAVDPFMVPLLDALSIKHPRWKYVAKGHGTVWDNNVCYYTHFRVFEDGFELGYVSRDSVYRRGTGHIAVYEWGNPRVRAVMTRRTCKQSKDVAIATKGVLSMFYKPTIPERLDATASEAVDIRNRVVVTTHNMMRESENRFMAALRAAFEADPVAAIIPSSVRELWETYSGHRAPMNALDNEPGLTIVVMDGDQLCVRHGGATYLYRTDVPRVIAERIGLLRLVDDGTYIMGTGVRVTQASFGIVLQPGDLLP